MHTSRLDLPIQRPAARVSRDIRDGRPQPLEIDLDEVCPEHTRQPIGQLLPQAVVLLGGLDLALDAPQQLPVDWATRRLLLQ